MAVRRRGFASPAGSIVSSDEIARQPGTTVTVRSLFQNVPARAKFLRAAGAETRAVSEAVLLLALSNLRAAFHLDSNGRELLSLPPAETPADRVADIWGPEEAAQMLGVDTEVDGIRVGGLIQRPDAARAAGGRRYLFVNGRPFRDRQVVRAVDEAYRTTVAPGLRPGFLLYLRVEGGQVDVNVHPAKAEVRFSDPSRVQRAVEEAVRARLGAVSSAPGLGPEARGSGSRRGARRPPPENPAGPGTAGRRAPDRRGKHRRRGRTLLPSWVSSCPALPTTGPRILDPRLARRGYLRWAPRAWPSDPTPGSCTTRTSSFRRVTAC